MGIEDYSTVAADNDTASPDGWPEGMAAAGVNNSARQNMADIRTQQNDAEWFEFRDGTPDGVTTFVANNQFKIVSPTNTDVTGHWHVGRRVQITNAGTFFATITATSFSSDTTTVTVDITDLTNTTLVAFASITSAVNSPISTLDTDITVKTITATGDTAAGDSATLGFTAAEGAILTGQGSTNDVTIKNDADEDVMSVPTGTQNVVHEGNILLNDSPAVPGFPLTQGAVFHTAVSGATLGGQGSTRDVQIINKDGSRVMEVPTGTQDAVFSGDLTVNSGGEVFLNLPTSSSGTSGSLWSDSGTVKVVP